MDADTTNVSAVRKLASEDLEDRRSALQAVISAYWKPAYKHLRLKWRCSADDASDWVQAFFCEVLESESLKRYDADRSRFRTFLRVMLDGFAANQNRASTSIRRGGAERFQSMAFDDAEREIGDETSDPENIFDRQWLRTLIERGLDDVRKQLFEDGCEAHWGVYSAYDLHPEPGGPPATYASLAADYGMSTSQVAHVLSDVRARVRNNVLQGLREITGTEREAEREARFVFGD